MPFLLIFLSINAFFWTIYTGTLIEQDMKREDRSGACFPAGALAILFIWATVGTDHHMNHCTEWQCTEWQFNKTVVSERGK
jgi:hypothetical protein